VYKELNFKIVLAVLLFHFFLLSLLLISPQNKPLPQSKHKIHLQHLKLNSQPEKNLTNLNYANSDIKKEDLIQPLKIDKSDENLKEQVANKEYLKDLVTKKEEKKPVKKTDEKKIESKEVKKLNAPKDSKKAKEENKKKAKEESKQKNVSKEPQLKKVDSDLLKNIEQSLSKVGTNSKKATSSTSIQTESQLTLSSLNSSNSISDDSFELSYESTLQLYLKAHLILPEWGNVDIYLTVEKSGKVKSVKILKSDSKINKEYIEANLPKITLPPFGKHFAEKNEKSFNITLSNAL
jgi:colicin import membrane protein